MSNNRILGNLATYIDSASNGGAITKVGNNFFIQAMTDSDVGGTPATGFAGTDSSSVKGLFTTADIVQKSKKAKDAPGLKNVLQGNISKLNPSVTATYNIGDSSNPIDEIILDSSATIFFGAISLTSVLKSGTSAIAAVAAAAAASPVAGSAETSFLLKTDSTQSDAQADASTNAFTITESGDVTSTAFTPYHPKGYQIEFDGTGDYLKTPALGTLPGEFTFECWFRSNNGGDAIYLVDQGDRDTNLSIQTDYLSSDITYIKIAGTSLSFSSCGYNGTDWNHIALVRDASNNVGFFVNGTRIGSNSTVTGTVASNPYYIGSNSSGSGNAGYSLLNGSLSHFRISDTDRYTATASSLTVPTQNFSDDNNTKVLLAQGQFPFIDGSSNSHSITLYGNLEISVNEHHDHVAYSPSSHGGSVYFDGTGDYLTTSSNIHNGIGTGDFTAEAWVYLDEAIGSNRGIFGSGSSDAADEFTLLLLTNGSLYFDYGGSQDYVQTGAVFTANTWHHIALTRSGTSFNIWLNGTSVASTTLSANIGGSSNFAVGWGRGIVWKGYISDARFVTGTAVYTAAFTPPTQPLTAISGTQLLTCTNKNSIYDAAAGQDVTATGDAAASTTQYKWSSSTAFDDNGDYLTATVDPPGTGDYTLECWVRFNSMSAGNQSILSFGNYSPAIYYRSASSELAVYYSSAFYLSGFTPVADTWYHIAWTRSGTSCRLFVDGIQKGTTASNAHNVNNTNLRIGYDGVDYFGGYIEDVRYTKGLARYTADFTPPTAALEG